LFLLPPLSQSSFISRHGYGSTSAMDGCNYFKNIIAKTMGEKICRLRLNIKLNFIIILVFEKNAIFSPNIVENRRKL
jgi:hypothetical protein